MIIPIGHEQDTVRRIPIVTFVLMGICLFVHVMVTNANNRLEKDLTRDLTEMMQYYAIHPYLELDPELEKLLELDPQTKEAIRSQFGSITATPGSEVMASEQEHLSRLMAGILDKIDKAPYQRWGLNPTVKKAETFISYIFLHGGWLHLISNLFLLYLCGPVIEDLWGRLLFPVFYLLAGIFSGLAYSIIYPDLDAPLIGASGAIAGVMGAFLIRCWRTRIRFFYLLIFVSGTFLAPAWLMLPMWFILEFVNANAMDIMGSQGGGVAHWAHVWGFVFGVAVAFLFKMLRVDEKVNAAQENDEDRYVDPKFKLVEDAGQLIGEGKTDGAWQLLLQGARAYPGFRDISDQLWQLAVQTGREKEAARAMVRVIETELLQRQYALALSHLHEVRSRVPDLPLSVSAYLMEIQALIHENRTGEALDLYSRLVRSISPRTPPAPLIDFCRQAIEWDKRFGQKHAPRIFQLCLQHPEIPRGKKEDLERLMKQYVS